MTWIDWAALAILASMTGLYFGILIRIGFIIIEQDRRPS